MNTRAWPDQFRVQLWSGLYETTWVDYGQYGDPHASRLVGPSPDPRRSSPSTSSYWSRRTFELAPPQRASSRSAVGRVERRGRGLGSLSRFGDGVDQSVVAALVASGMRCAGWTERDLVTGIAATTIPPERGWTAHRRPLAQGILRLPRARGDRPAIHPNGRRESP